MSLQPGQVLGSYRLIEKIGEGGMGVVWKALDPSLNREVAIKTLPDGFTADAERLARFEREARLLASLNHPHIASVFGFHAEGDLRYLALEYLAGEDLSLRLAGGPLETRQAVRIALQVAEALEAAHENGVIHRDLKPGNIKFTGPAAGSGSTAATGIESVKVLDFGLAKGMDETSAAGNVTQSPTLTAAATREGVILGTAAYMSPEQARGHAADRRSDIWSFGAVLYEMLTGRRPFAGETVSDTLAAVLRAEPDYRALPADVPPTIRRLLRRCLEKDPRHRQQAIGDARIILENVLAGRDEDEGTAAIAAPGQRLSPWLMLAAGLILGGAVVGWLAGSLAPAPEPAPLRKFPITLPTEGEGVAEDPDPMISPDGSTLIYSHGGRLLRRSLDQWEILEIADSEGAEPLAWSPDSRFFAFAREEKLWKHTLAGGQSTVISPLPMRIRNATWGYDGRIVFISGEGDVMSVSERGGDPVAIQEPVPEVEDDFHHAAALPDGSSLLVVVHRLNAPPNQIDLLSGDERRTVLEIEGARIGRMLYSPTGHIVYRRYQGNDGIWAVPFSLDSREVTGEPFLVAADGSDPSISHEGTLTHMIGNVGTYELVWVDRQGTAGGSIGQPQEWIFDARLSPDGRRVAVAAMDGEEEDIWIHDAERNTKSRITFEAGRERYPTWTPDGKQVAYAAQRMGPTTAKVEIRAADGTGTPAALADGSHPGLSPDGGFLVLEERLDDATYDLHAVPLGQDGPGERKGVSTQAGVSERMPALSPDGRFMAYRSNESGKMQIYIKRFPEGEGKWQVSTDGGTRPRWKGDGTELYYAEADRMMAVPVDISGDAPRLGQPRKLFSWLSESFISGVGYDVAGDGERFVMVRPVRGEEKSQEIRVVQNWLAEFESAD